MIDLAQNNLSQSSKGCKGVHGIAIVNEVNKDFISDGRGNAVVVVDLTSFKIIKDDLLAGDG